jgi:hypothetical protein
MSEKVKGTKVNSADGGSVTQLYLRSDNFLIFYGEKNPC